jgi:uncharacterized protein YkwD
VQPVDGASEPALPCSADQTGDFAIDRFYKAERAVQQDYSHASDAWERVSSTMTKLTNTSPGAKTFSVISIGLLALMISGCPQDPTGILPTSGTSGTTVDSGYCEPTTTPRTTTHQAMLEALNNYRVANGLSELLYSPTLEAAADAHAEDMFVRSFFDHTNPDGDGPLDRAIAAGFCSPRYVGENIAFRQWTVTQVQQEWQDSPGHDANMLTAEYVFVGMGYYRDVFGQKYWVQLFGTTWE